MNRALAALYVEGRETADLERTDPRTGELVDEALAVIIELNRAGRTADARELLDAPIGALYGAVQQHATPLSMVVMTRDEVYVRQGSAWQEVTTWRLRGDVAEVVPGVLAMGISANRSIVAAADADGVTTRRDGEVVHRWPAPNAALIAKVDGATWPVGVEHLAVSNDGTRIALVGYRYGILVGSARGGDEPWRLVYPSEHPPFESEPDQPDGTYEYVNDMLHCDLSPDGTLLAVGHQSSYHYLLDLDAGPEASLVANLGIQSEYPHHCRFSTDGRYVAFNSCHFYNGATISFDTTVGTGVETAPYESDSRTPLIDDNLRVYGSTWLPPGVADREGVFCLHGVGVVRGVTPTGRLVFAQTVPSSGGGMDFDPATGRLAVCGYSGMLHVFDAATEATEHRGEEGWRPRRELRRWFFWLQLHDQPFAW